MRIGKDEEAADAAGGDGVKVRADYPTKRARAKSLLEQAVAMMDGTTVNTWRLKTDLEAVFDRATQHGCVLPDEEAQ